MHTIQKVNKSVFFLICAVNHISRPSVSPSLFLGRCSASALPASFWGTVEGSFFNRYVFCEGTVIHSILMFIPYFFSWSCLPMFFILTICGRSSLLALVCMSLKLIFSVVLIYCLVLDIFVFISIMRYLFYHVIYFRRPGICNAFMICFLCCLRCCRFHLIAF